MHEPGDAGQRPGQLASCSFSSLSIALSIEVPTAVALVRSMLRVGALLRHFTRPLADMSAPSNGAADALQRVSDILGRGDGWQKSVRVAVESSSEPRPQNLPRERDAVGRWAIGKPGTVSDDL